MPTMFKLSIENSSATFDCSDQASVLSALDGSGARTVSVGCRSGGCGVCRVQVLDGRYETGLMSREQISEDEQAQGIVLACRLFARSDLRLRPLGKLATRADRGTADIIRQLTEAMPKPHQLVMT